MILGYELAGSRHHRLEQGRNYNLRASIGSGKALAPVDLVLLLFNFRKHP